MTKCCDWCGTEEIYVDYHNKDWGVPVHDDRLHFEMIILDGAQAGLSWITILKRRESYRKAFDNFDVLKVSRYRNRLKVNSAVQNARSFLKIQKEFGSFDKYIWQFVNHKTIQNKWKKMSELPAKTAQSDAMSKDLKKRGFSFVGSTICYAYMQAAGLVNDHTLGCFRYKEVKKISGSSKK